MPEYSSDPILWNDSYATGVAEIDEQHQILVNTLNDANAKLMKDTSTELLAQITKDLLSYALYHFETEENLMQEYGYVEDCAEDNAAHLAQHRSFSANVVAVRDQIKSGHQIQREELLRFLNGWLINHILNTDKKLGAFVAAKRGG